MANLDDNFLTPGEIAERLKVDKSTIQREIKRGCLEAVRVGKQCRIPERALEGYLKRNTQYSKG